MAWRSHGATNKELIENLYTNKLIKDVRVKEAFLKVDRAHYAPSRPYDDRPQSIGHGATISAPHMHATAVESILPFILPSEANPAPRVLDVGSGSGYLTHVLAELVGERGKVVGVEHVPQLVEMAERNMGKSEEGRRLLESGRVRFVVGDGRMGWVEEEEERGESEGDGGKEGTGWNAIHVGASAVTVHDELVRQLRRPGRMFIPVDDEGGSGEQFIWTVDKKEDGQMERRKLFGVRYVPLTDAPK